jgi:hypothetical protein
MSKRRPVGVTLLAVLAGLGALVAIWHTLQLLHILPVTLDMGEFGEVRFFTFDLVGAIIWGLLAAIWIWVVRMLWSMNPQGWLYVTVLAVLNLVMAFFAILGTSTFQSVLPDIVLYGVILIYCLLPGTKAAFEIP